MNSIDLIKRLQAALIHKGYNLGPWGADGIAGRMTTAAVAKYQHDNGIDVKWPGTIGPKTISHLLGGQSHDELTAALESDVIARPWYDLALTKKGLHEKRDNAELRKFLKEDGKTLGDPAVLPWCGDFVETCVAVTLPNEPLPANPYLARNWQKFGRACEIQLGAIAVFWRTSRTNSTNGHVAFVAGIGDGVIYVLGGNQSNTISVTKLDLDRLLGTYWPTTSPLPNRIILPRMIGGVLSTNEA